MSVVDDALSAVLLRRSPVPARPPAGPRARPADHRAERAASQLPPPERHAGGGRRRRFTPAQSWSLAAAIPAAMAIGMAVEPEANGPEPIGPVWLDAIAGGTIMAALFAVVALVAVQWIGVWLAAITGAGMFVLTLLCPVSGHHVPGSYTYVQFALAGGLLVASGLVLARCRPPSDSGDHARLVV